MCMKLKAVRKGYPLEKVIPKPKKIAVIRPDNMSEKEEHVIRLYKENRSIREIARIMQSRICHRA